MKLVKLIEFLRERLKAVVWGAVGLLVLTVVLDVVLVNKEHTETSLERWPGFWAGFGFLACVAIILISKWFGHAGIMKKEDYYDE